MGLGRRGKQLEEVEEVVAEDPTGWMVTSSLAEFLLMHTYEIKYMCMLGYTFFTGCKLFAKFPADAPLSYKFIQMAMACTGGGILVPIFINSIPVPLTQDAYPVAITVSFCIHNYLPIVREIMKLSAIVKALIIVMYETFRAYVVVILTNAAAEAIAPSSFSFPVFGPIMCGAIAGCGGAFLPLDKGLGPIRNQGLAPNMLSALLAATVYHLYLNSPLSEDVIDAAKKAHVHVAIFFIAVGWANAFDFLAAKEPAVVPQTKKEK